MIRLLVVTLASLAVLLILRLIWGEIARRRVDAALAKIRSGGDPTTIDELYPASDPDPRDNAVPIIQQAMAAMNTSVWSPRNSNSSIPPYPPYPRAWHQMMDAAMQANAKSLALMRQAQALHHFYWPRPSGTTPPMGMPSMKSLSLARSLTNLLSDAAEDAAFRGDGMLALQRIAQVLQIGDAIDAQHTLVSHLVAIGIHSLANNVLCEMAPGLAVPPKNENDPLRQQMRALIARMINDNDGDDSMRQALIGERIEQIDVTRWLDEKVWVIRPMEELELARMLRVDDELFRGAQQPSWPASQAMMPDFPGSATTHAATIILDNRFSHALSHEFMSSMGRFIQVNFVDDMEAHMTAISLAAQLYRADHHGRWPATIADLVPAYLPKIPTDPLAASGTPMGYLLLKNALADGHDRPLLHSVGRNSIDDMPRGQRPPTVPVFISYSVNRTLDDQFCDLSRWSPADVKKHAASRPQAVQH